MKKATTNMAIVAVYLINYKFIENLSLTNTLLSNLDECCCVYWPFGNYHILDELELKVQKLLYHCKSYHSMLIAVFFIFFY